MIPVHEIVDSSVWDYNIEDPKVLLTTDSLSFLRNFNDHISYYGKVNEIVSGQIFSPENIIMNINYDSCSHITFSLGDPRFDEYSSHYRFILPTIKRSNTSSSFED